MLVETDTSNPDVGKAYQDHIPTELIDLDHADGWIALVNLCDQHGDKTVVINTAARNNLGLARYAQTLGATLQELQRHLVTLWVINRNRDSLELLKEYRESMACGQIHVVRNGFFGAEEAFDLYNDSNLRRTIEAEGGQSLVFPTLASRVRDTLALGDNDALWLIIMALQHYQSLYDALPDRIRLTTKETLDDVCHTAAMTFKAEAEATKHALAHAVATTAEEVARNTTCAKRAKWLSLSAAVLSLVFVLIAGSGYFVGFGVGNTAGYKKAADEKAATYWSTTPEGQAAYALAKTANIRDFLECSRPGWYVKNGVCYPASTKDGQIYGWSVR